MYIEKWSLGYIQLINFYKLNTRFYGEITTELGKLVSQRILILSYWYQNRLRMLTGVNGKCSSMQANANITNVLGRRMLKFFLVITGKWQKIRLGPFYREPFVTAKPWNRILRIFVCWNLKCMFLFIGTQVSEFCFDTASDYYVRTTGFTCETSRQVSWIIFWSVCK